MTAALIGAAILWAVLSPSAALVLGRVMRARNRQIPRPRPCAATTLPCTQQCPEGCLLVALGAIDNSHRIPR